MLTTIVSWGSIFFTSHAGEFCLRAMPKLDYVSFLFQELHVESSRCFDAVSQLLPISPHSHIGVDAISHLRIVEREKPTPILSLL